VVSLCLLYSYASDECSPMDCRRNLNFAWSDSLGCSISFYLHRANLSYILLNFPFFRGVSLNRYLAVLALLVLGCLVFPCQGQVYKVVICGAYHVKDDMVVVTPLYATDVIDDTVEGTLSFKVLEHPTDYTQVIAASTNLSDVDKPLESLPIFMVLEPDDIVEINYKDCEYSEKVVQKEPLTQNYWIVYIGEANSVKVNMTEIPEFPGWLLATFIEMLLFIVFLRFLKR